jgi:pimeloyl-ACP methyl ester carboxylesterase
VPVAQVISQAVVGAWRIYHPKRRPPRHTPASLGLSAERVWVHGADGVRLACWFVPRAGARNVVVLGHGMARDSGMVMPLVKVLHEAGYHVATFDMRNHGESGDGDWWRGQSPRYAIDFHHVVRHLMQRPELAGAKIACVGFSMGAWTALAVANLEPETVRAVVCDSGPTLDIKATIRRMYAAGRSRLPVEHRGPILFRIGRQAFTLASLAFLRPEAWPQEFADHSIELLFIAGAEDPVVRPDDVRDQLRWYPKAELWMVPRANHVTALVVASEEYGRRVLGLLEKAFGPPPVEAVGA